MNQPPRKKLLNSDRHPGDCSQLHLKLFSQSRFWPFISMLQLPDQKRNRVGVHGAKSHHDILVPLRIDHWILRLSEPPLDGFPLVPRLANPPDDARSEGDESDEESAVRDAPGNSRRLFHRWILGGTEADTQGVCRCLDRRKSPRPGHPPALTYWECLLALRSHGPSRCSRSSCCFSRCGALPGLGNS